MNRLQRLIPLLLLLLFFSCRIEQKSSDMQANKSGQKSSDIVASIPKAEPIALEGTITISMLESKTESYNPKTLDTLIVHPHLSQITIDSSTRYAYNYTITLYPEKLRIYGISDSVMEAAIRKVIIPDSTSKNTIDYPQRAQNPKFKDQSIYIRGTYYSARELAIYRPYGKEETHPDTTLPEMLESAVLPLPIKESIELQDVAKVNAYKSYRRRWENGQALYIVTCAYKGNDLLSDIQQLKKRLRKLSASYIITVKDKAGKTVSPYARDYK